MSLLGFVPEIVDNSAQIIEEFKRCVMRGANAIGSTAVRHAKKDCPVGTPESTGIKDYIGGTLRGSITKEVVTEDNDEISIYIGTDVPYGKYVEFIDRYKHKKGKAHFLRDAATTHNEEYKAIMESSLAAGGQNIWRKNESSE